MNISGVTDLFGVLICRKSASTYRECRGILSDLFPSEFHDYTMGSRVLKGYHRRFRICDDIYVTLERGSQDFFMEVGEASFICCCSEFMDNLLMNVQKRKADIPEKEYLTIIYKLTGRVYEED